MTVLSWQWLLTRPRRPAVVIRSGRPGRRRYADSFFADPAAVEDDSRRMRLGTPRPTQTRRLM